MRDKNREHCKNECLLFYLFITRTVHINMTSKNMPELAKLELAKLG